MVLPLVLTLQLQTLLMPGPVPLLGFALADGGYEETSKVSPAAVVSTAFTLLALLWDHLVFVNINRTLRA